MMGGGGGMGGRNQQKVLRCTPNRRDKFTILRREAPEHFRYYSMIRRGAPEKSHSSRVKEFFKEDAHKILAENND